LAPVLPDEWVVAVGPEPYERIIITSIIMIIILSSVLTTWMSTLQGLPVLTSGSSASAPIIAGLVARLNEELLAAGRPPLGFLNPLL
jgi:hypothetical protein